MSKQAAFWDASALVPLCVQEASSRQAHTQLRKFMPVVWWGSPVEVHSAIARLHGSGNLKDVEKQGALSRLDLLSRGWREILPGDHVRDLAQRLLDTHELRAADSQIAYRSEEHTSELQSQSNLVCRLLLEKKKN